MGKRSKVNNNKSSIEDLDSYELEDEGFIEGDTIEGTAIATFNFSMAGEPTKSEGFIQVQPVIDKSPVTSTVEEKICSSAPRGLTPPINGEYYTVKRSYQMRPSTVRKLNELKARHPDVNVLFNTIVDLAILHYYDYIVNENGEFCFQEDKKLSS